MRVPRFVLRGLLRQAGLTLSEKTICMLIEEYHPRSIYELSRLAHLSRKPVTKACKHLAGLGWVTLVKSDLHVCPMPLIPRIYQEEMVRILDVGYKVAGNKGEFLMKRCLDVWVQSDEYEENARPEFLKNPNTGALLEYDRYYFQGVAFEFNGTQHYEPTEVFNDKKAIDDLKTRDLIKDALSRRNGIELITITAHDLEPLLFGNVIPEKLPKSAVLTDGIYCQELTRLCRSHRAKTPEPSGSAQQTRPSMRKNASPDSQPNRP